MGVLIELLKKSEYRESNLKFMRSFYEAWKHVFENRQTLYNEFMPSAKFCVNASEIEIRQLATAKA